MKPKSVTVTRNVLPNPWKGLKVQMGVLTIDPFGSKRDQEIAWNYVSESMDAEKPVTPVPFPGFVAYFR